MLSASLRRSTWVNALLALMLIFVFTTASLNPAVAETAGQRSTRNIIIGALALTAGIILYNNYHHKQVAANTIVGRTPDGGIVYADGRIVYPDGTVVYTSNNGRNRCSYDGYYQPCGPTARGYAWRYEDEREWHGRGKHKGWYKHHGEHEDEGDGGDRGD